jgi:alpha-L-arabinofuranosidase
MRKDLMEALKALNPSFLRMPGGNNMYVLRCPETSAFVS